MQTEAQYFRENVPVTLRRAIARVVFAGCASAYKQAKARDKDFFLDAIPALRRLEVEPALSKLILPKGFSVEVVRTTSTNYTQIASKKVVITAVSRAEDVTWVEPYRYRQTLARGRQVNMFTSSNGMAQWGSPSDEASPDAKLYALVVYGGPHKSEAPTIAKIVFPTPQGDICCDGIDLIQEHDDVASQYKPAEATTATPKLKKKTRSEEG